MNSTWQDWNEKWTEFKPVWMGLLMVAAVALSSRLLYWLIPGLFLKYILSEALLAIMIGLTIRNWVGIGERYHLGISFSINRILRFGIILIGLRLSMQDIASTGIIALVLVIVSVTIVLSLAVVLGKWLKAPPRLAALIGIGTAVCGNSAIIATAPVIEAKEEEVSFAVATITLLGVLAVVSYPLIGHLASFSDRVFGLWAGLAVNDTSQVLAAGAAFSEPALSIATIVKLTRNTLLVPLIFMIGAVYQRSARRRSKIKAQSGITFSNLVPGFVLGFLLMALIRTLGIYFGVLPHDLSNPGNLTFAANLLTGLDEAARFAILMALAGVGLNTDMMSMRKIGLKPFLLGTLLAAVLALVSLGLISFVTYVD
jgi:uncharacterized integral membrane protein (TIGR00698 family)